MTYKLEFKTTETGCIVPLHYTLNADGYFRKLKNGRLWMWHRVVWEEANGPIEEGYEIDHMCRNRACCNIEHLQKLERSEHKAKGNRLRYLDRLLAAKDYWIKTQCSSKELADKFGVTIDSSMRWIRSFKKADNHP